MTDPSVVYDVKTVLDEAGIEVISADSPMVSDNLVPITDLKRRQGGAADPRGARGQRRRAGRVLQLRHQRRADGSGGVVSLGVGDRRPGLHVARPPAAATCRSATTAGQPVVLVFYPGDDTPVCTKQLNSYNDELEKFTRLERPGARHLGAGHQQPRRVRRQARLRRSRCSPTPTRRSPGCTARSDRSGSPAAACSSSTPTAWSATPTGRSPG